MHPKRFLSSPLVVGGILLVVLGTAWPVWRFIAARTGPAIEVHAVAHQWWWEFDYPRLGVKVANELYLPEDRRVRMVLTSADVVHSFWLPSMKLAMDVVPGRKSSLVFITHRGGTLHGSCGAGCGCAGVCMDFRVQVTDESDFQNWIKKERGVSLSSGNTSAPACVLNPNSDAHPSSSPAGKLAALLDNDSRAPAPSRSVAP
jgi:cytochrome c oxidase subunit II